MFDPTPEFIDALQLARLSKTRAAMKQLDVPALLILDSINILYATGASNMTIFSTRTPARYLLIIAEGPVILFDYFGCEHLAKDLPTIDKVMPARGLCYTSSGGDVEASASLFAGDIRATIDEFCRGERRLAIDRFPFSAVDALRKEQFTITSSDRVFADARQFKTAEELRCMREAIRRVEGAVADLESAIAPGMTENSLWSKFYAGLIDGGGQYVATRLMQSGERTFPYFQECSARRIQQGDLVCLDTDALGYLGYAVDFSRTFVCGEALSPDQRTLYQLAREQLEHNVDLFKPGASFEEIAQRAWPIPEQHQDSRYYCIAHGLGMSGEYPNIPHTMPGQDYPLHGCLMPGMVMCVESYIGSKDSGQGVKLEQQLEITPSGAVNMSGYAFLDS